MQLLLLLSALLTSLTGAMAGARSLDVRPVEASSALVQAAAEVVAVPRRIVPIISPAPALATCQDVSLSFSVPLAVAGGRYERLLE